jgi:hypothetical protein
MARESWYWARLCRTQACRVPGGLAMLKPGHYNLYRLAWGGLGLWGRFVGLVTLGGRQIPVPLDGLAIDFALDGDEGVKELIGDVGQDGGTARGNAVLDDQDEELGEELIDLVGGLEIVELDREVGGEVDVNGLRRLDLQCGMTKAEAGAQGAQAAAATACGEMSAL